MSRVLVTGASGFIGRHALAPLVAAGFEVHAVSRRRRDGPDGVAWHRADLLDADAGAGLARRTRPSHLLHFAWVTEHGAFWDSPENARWRQASEALIGAFAAAGGRRAVVAGSCAEYDPDACRGAPCRETATPCAPHSRYGRAKDALHRALAAGAAGWGLGYAWGRVFFLYGPAEPPGRLVPSVIRSLLAGDPAPCTHGRQVRDFMDSRDAGAAFAALTAGEVQGPVNVASGEAVTVAEVATRLGALVGRPELVQLGAVAAPDDEPPRLVADVTRLAREVGFRPRHTLDSGLADAVGWWRARG